MLLVGGRSANTGRWPVERFECLEERILNEVFLMSAEIAKSHGQRTARSFAAAPPDHFRIDHQSAAPFEGERESRCLSDCNLRSAPKKSAADGQIFDRKMHEPHVR